MFFDRDDDAYDDVPCPECGRYQCVCGEEDDGGWAITPRPDPLWDDNTDEGEEVL